MGLALYWRWYRPWVQRLRDAPFACPTCGQPMHKLDSTAEKSHLEPGQQVEEKSQTIDYDVWECASGHHLRLAYLNPDKEASVCPACHYRTLAPGRGRPVQAATTAAAGWGWQVAKCRFCQHEAKKKVIIARLPSPSSSSSGGSSFGSSSSGSSSGSSSSTSSGGSSGGGGAGSSW
ncbi:MAG: hypothetical protein EOO59_09395 [Hymenobacter sp.]|nr:MAG: hypothetical protein EOO59_09395 [Hymenobacter sp.]